MCNIALSSINGLATTVCAGAISTIFLSRRRSADVLCSRSWGVCAQQHVQRLQYVAYWVVAGWEVAGVKEVVGMAAVGVRGVGD